MTVTNTNDNNNVNSVINTSEQVQIANVSKRHFMQWWRLHTYSYPIRTYKGVTDAQNIIRMTDNGINIIGAQFNVYDQIAEQLPFRMNMVDSFVIDMPNLRSFENCPKYCRTTGQFGTNINPMSVNSLIGCPLHIQSLILYTSNKLNNLENSFQSPVENLQIQAQEISSFQGIKHEVHNLNIVTTHQTSFKHIHRELHNVKKLTVGYYNSEHDIGVLPFAMLDSDIEVIADMSCNIPINWADAMNIVSTSRKDGANVHDIQEKLIDGGYSKYAKL